MYTLLNMVIAYSLMRGVSSILFLARLSHELRVSFSDASMVTLY